ncbi:competence/damage-inducible protein A [Acetivibrio saccincola]|jgi:nicotinamide-nucleotide amidase|uniref:Putative competence-damage inducible protein n=1 Tax=Acetivibrio saccincola TaxID=1677857 RepID=A0A2K9ELI1_9FIRM|nr:competence/damage-inducible protein A [Acetivibrio saccincola]AUG57441.1 Putative competence-damage inducible protein [Acetivibrio saccincola]NLW27492.1 competence/damage-inducible protein A [Acetivibrio saccincola]PQQ67367.1 competence/damage-inducible protein A [Acetivibrio saccincola]HOA97396.1 competence/damage-inducible protein A [Acetivibrio saccincola]HQD29830.1 competence/damage-inducible protein A [Acetivibrio saccincola]
MNAEILAVGTELLMGQIVNTNAQYISERLNSIGINVYFHSVVGDNPKRLESSIKLALERSDLVVITGGLGPTKDDITKEKVAEVFGKRMVLHEESLKRIKDYFVKLGREMTDNNAKQAYFPEGSIVIENNKGTAPGCIIESDNKFVVILPGPPREMQPMFDESVMPYLQKDSGYKIVSKYIRTFGIGESKLEEMIMDLVDKQEDVTIATYAKMGEVTVRLTCKCPLSEEGFDKICPFEDEIVKRLGSYVYSTENENLEKVVTKMLLENNLTIAIAESCTGGLICSKLVSVSGVSKVFNRGIISYSNDSKVQDLGVNEDTIKKYGAVSTQTAIEMAEGVKRIAGTDIGVSITGIAGPEGGTAEKPVGLMYMALAYKGNTVCKKLNLSGDRERIINVASLHVLDLIRRQIGGIEI